MFTNKTGFWYIRPATIIYLPFLSAMILEAVKCTLLLTKIATPLAFESKVE